MRPGHAEIVGGGFGGLVAAALAERGWSVRVHERRAAIDAEGYGIAVQPNMNPIFRALGIRLRPTGGMTWVMLEDADGRTKRVSPGPVSTMTVDEARREYHERKARPETGRPVQSPRAVPTFRAFVEGEWREAHFERCKPAIRKGYFWLLDARLRRVLDAHSGGRGAAQADLIRLLPLTRCRRNEIVRLRWSEVQDDTLVLADSKVGPRKVPLSARARAILDRRPRGESPFVFPSPGDPSRPYGKHLSLWNRVRREAGIEDCRLHDLRHTHASHAVMNGVPVPGVSHLLGHSNTRMSLRYAHLGDRDIEAAAERAGEAVADPMGL